jgi:hypothetical protein
MRTNLKSPIGIDAISQELKDKIPAIPKKGFAVYESLLITADTNNNVAKICKTKIPAQCTIFDPWGGEDGNGALVDIFYHLRGFGKEPKLGEIILDKNNQGRIKIFEHDKEKLALHQYLFLSKFNISNKDKDWGKTVRKGYYTYINKENDAEKANTRKRLVVEAQSTIFKQEDNWFEMIRAAKYNPNMSIEEVKNMLLNECENNPDVIFSLVKDKQIALRADLKLAESHKIISRDSVHWKWVTDKSFICGIKSQDPYSDLISFLTSSERGQDTRVLLKNLLNESLSQTEGFNREDVEESEPLPKPKKPTENKASTKNK